MAVTQRMAYRCCVALSLIGCLLLFTVHGDVGAQTPDDKGGAAKKDKGGLFDDAEIDETKAKPDPAGPPHIIDLKKAANDLKLKLHNRVRLLFAELAEPHDRINYHTEKPFKAKGYSDVKPLPKYYDDKNPLRDELAVEEFNDAFEILDKPLKVPSKEVLSIKPYEKIALDSVAKFMEQSINDLPQYSQALAAEQAISFVLDWHEKARARGVRSGVEWDTLVASLRKQLLRVNLVKLKTLTELHEWDAAFALAKRLTEGNPDEAAVAGPFAELMQQSLTSPLDPQMRELARQQLEKLHEAFPNNKPINEVVDKLKDKTERLLAEAKKLASNSNATREELEKSQHLIAQALETWPSYPGLRDYAGQIRIKYPILRVGVRALPKFMSPSMACTDTERRMVEFLFESLVKYSPDATGMGHYHSGLAEGRAEVIPLGRQFQLADGARWSNDQEVTANDVSYTVQQFKKGESYASGAAWSEMFAQQPVYKVGNRINVRLSQGLLEPLSLMTFKIVPNPNVLPPGTDEATFAEKPVGSGPFKYVASKAPLYDNGRPYLSFIVNESFGLRKSKLSLPRLSEVRVFTYTDAAAELKDKDHVFLDMLLDLTVAEADKLKEIGSPVGFRLTLPEPIAELPNRRVYFLAINHRRADLGTEKNEKIRRALAQAIDREKLLDDCFRGSFGSVLHKRLNGPFPATSWANDPGLVAQNKKKFDPVMAPSILNELTNELNKKNLRFQPPTLTLKYPTGSPDVERAMQAMATQIQTSLPGFVIKPQKVDPYTLRDVVEKTHDYDLAYYYYDFPDDTDSLWPLLGGEEKNYLGYSSTHLSDLLRKLLHHCEFAEVKKLNHELHRYVDLHVPLIPLWQLDPVHAIHKSVKTVPFDRHLVFTDIEKWELQGKGRD
jgi:ABC-type transport system substrate-binding protein